MFIYHVVFGILPIFETVCRTIFSSASSSVIISFSSFSTCVNVSNIVCLHSGPIAFGDVSQLLLFQYLPYLGSALINYFTFASASILEVIFPHVLWPFLPHSVYRWVLFSRFTGYVRVATYKYWQPFTFQIICRSLTLRRSLSMLFCLCYPNRNINRIRRYRCRESKRLCLLYVGLL